jgi:hypothetical protein
MTAAPVPSLHFYTNDIDDFIRVIDERGIHPTETDVVSRMMSDLIAENDKLRQELREAQTYRDNADAEELNDLRADLDHARERIYRLEIELHDARRDKK